MRRLAPGRATVIAKPQPASWLGAPFALAAGFVLRALFVWRHPRFAGDALVYGEMAHHMLKEHVYGLMDYSVGAAGVLKPTLIRLPGYPLFLAAVFGVFGDANYLAVIWVQVFVGLAACLVLAGTARRIAGQRAGMWVLWLAMLCPLTANYVAVAVAECCSMFCVTLAMYGLARWVSAWREREHPDPTHRCAMNGAPGDPPRSQKRDPFDCAQSRLGRPDGWLRWAVVVGIALSAAVLLRPDQGLLAAAVVPAMLWVGLRKRGRNWGFRIAPAMVASLIVVLPLCFWGVRNWRIFHVVQPLSPKYANDPGEEVALGFMRWYRTWAIGFPATVNVYWRYDGDPISMNDLPSRAFDSPEQREETAKLIAKYNEEQASTPPVDAAFARLAEERVRAHPLRYYVELPVARLADMWFRPRIEYMKVPLDWWRFGAHPWNSLRAYALGALNVVYLLLACAGLWMWRRRGGVVVWSMAAFVLLRCALLLTIDNSEPRYTMECYPVVLLLAGMAAAWWRTRQSHSSLAR